MLFPEIGCEQYRHGEYLKPAYEHEQRCEPFAGLRQVVPAERGSVFPYGESHVAQTRCRQVYRIERLYVIVDEESPPDEYYNKVYEYE